MTARRRLPVRTAVISAIAAFSVLAGALGSYAYWTASAQATLGAGAATLTATATGWSGTTLGNESIAAAGSTALTSTGSVTITNTTSTTSSQSQTLTATFSAAGGDAALAAGTTLTVWPVASTANCTPAAVPSGQQTGTWGAGVTITRTLAPGGSAVLCLRNTVADRQDVAAAAGSRSFTPQVAAVLGIGSYTGTATASSTIATQHIHPLQPINSAAWYYIKRAGSDWCWDVSGSGTTNGSLLISYACKNNSDLNQDWRYLDADGDGYGNFQARHASGIRIGASASSASGSAVTMLTTDNASAQQQWQPQLVAADTYQFVNRSSGLCLSMPATSAGAATQVTCSGGADQRFTFTKRATISLTSFTCTSTGSGENRSAQFSWTADYAGDNYEVQVRRNSSSPWQTIPSTGSSTAAIPAPIGAPYTSWGAGTYSVQIVNSFGEVVGTDTVTVAAQNVWLFVFDYFYARC